MNLLSEPSYGNVYNFQWVLMKRGNIPLVQLYVM